MLNKFSFHSPLILLVAVLTISILPGSSGTGFAQNIVHVNKDLYASEDIVRTYDLDDIENLSITASSYLHGSLEIYVGDVQETEIHFRKRYKADSQEQAESFDDYIDIRLDQFENEFAVAAQTHSSPPWSGTNYSAAVDIEIITPRYERLKIFVRTSSYDIRIDGEYAVVDVASNFGDVSVSGIRNKINIDCDNAAVLVRNCTGPTRVETKNRPIQLESVDSQLGTIRLRNDNGRIKLLDVRGEIDARTEYAEIDADGISFEPGRSILSTENSQITISVDEINGDLLVRNENNHSTLLLPQDISAALSLEIDESGRIYTNALPIKVETVTRTLLRGGIGSMQNSITVDMKGVGTIELEGRNRKEAPKSET